ncbi:class I SAM-dependent methyltransferase [Alkaliphilus oremlandii]|uniref:Uncharacterized methyltransferase Clos_1076 n=1 Tax=Alkaliphilus oremlandii (strain OhILAs) TaxID=350688 RepID=Y1076_ALKOO|nr:class I SAM-dependent methyltransferase [Alkaliphilus oremlandii]A8MGS9.1 RecName: Full=Uncharacterized methyltransferase Clos_1076 [Alkaliphilus oremlandii OhILAs]ABW18623.1 Methyltransferase type 12 [Alkaliphilus oremlandii OhILAs]
MADFNQLFDQWANTYDNTVFSTDNEYTQVFERYETTLQSICDAIQDKKQGLTLEIGVGTGNLTKHLEQQGFQVIGIEPSKQMRRIAKDKLPHIEIVDGHFLSIPVAKTFDSIVTSYAFHHLNLEEKHQALTYLDSFLNQSGKIVIADTMFESEEYKRELLNKVEKDRAYNLLEDLKAEYYEYINDITDIFLNLGYSFTISKMNKYVWIICATKGGL